MKNFTQYFGGEYQKYWYIATFIILIIMAFFMYNNRAVTEYELTIYNSDGTVQSTQIVDGMYYSTNNAKLGVAKKYVPVKPF